MYAKFNRAVVEDAGLSGSGSTSGGGLLKLLIQISEKVCVCVLLV